MEDSTNDDLIKDYRNKLIRELKNRPEGYVKDGKLIVGCEIRNTL